ncbi:MAG TPA: hypothetical protein VJB38_08570 [Bacteroidota bacterium]|nr:hypothetical protein [Bacteroidota bacterium]
MQAKSKTLIFILLSFLLGAVGGGYFGASYFGPKRSARPSHAGVRKEFADRLKLTGNQPTQVDSILESNRKKFGEIRKEYDEVFRHQRDSLRRGIRSILSPEQNLLYDQYIKEMDERESRYRRESK